jgi:uncharacterized protein
MLKGIFKDSNPSRSIFLLFALAAMGFFTFLLIGSLANAILFGSFSIADFAHVDTNSHEGLMKIRVLQIAQTIGLFIFPSLLMAFLLWEKPMVYIGFKKVSLNILFLSTFAIVCFIPGVNLIASLNAKLPIPEWAKGLEQNAEEIIKALLVTKSPLMLALNIFVVAILPAVGEELFFRGVLQKLFIQWTKGVFFGVLITSLLFSSIHMQFLGFIPRVLLGMVFGYLYVWTKSIWVPIVVHFANNGIAVVLYYLVGVGVVSADIDTFGEVSAGWVMGLFSLTVGGVLLWVVKQTCTKDQNPPIPDRAVEYP